jgi:hypothetical protein
MNLTNEYYWYKVWHNDIELHDYIRKEFNIEFEKPEQISDEYWDYSTGSSIEEPGEDATPEEKEYWEYGISNKAGKEYGYINRRYPVSSYADTDSLFVSYRPAMDSIGFEGDELDFVFKVAKFRTEGFFKKALDRLGEKHGVENIQDFELEQISKSIIFLDKKMYIKNVVWDEGILREPETSLQAKGVDLVRSSTPQFVRENVYDILKYFFKNPSTYNERELNKMVRELKERFKIAPIEHISNTTGCSNYTLKVLDDQEDIVVEQGAHFGVKAAALHNYLLNNNSKYKRKYSLIRGGKIKYYKCKNEKNDNFGFVAGQYPMEIAHKYAPIDYDLQFEKTMLSIINRFNVVLGMSKLTPDLSYTLSLF